MIQVEIDSIRVSLMSQDRVVVLKDPDSDRYLPIWIGAFEAEAIRAELKNVPVARPLTHDLLKAVILELGGAVDHIYISDLRNDIFYARVVLKADGRTLEVDSRPSDAIALAVRVKVPIYVADVVMERAAIEPDEEITASSAPKSSSKPQIEDVTPPVSNKEDEELSIFKDFLDTLDMDDLEDNE
ncbi:MAG: bifunctional nuclease family protein [Anaerolineae bacterium]|nr:bifunctional nuclease family protein [Anaerolineae bacterium]